MTSVAGTDAIRRRRTNSAAVATDNNSNDQPVVKNPPTTVQPEYFNIHNYRLYGLLAALNAQQPRRVNQQESKLTVVANWTIVIGFVSIIALPNVVALLWLLGLIGDDFVTRNAESILRKVTASVVGIMALKAVAMWHDDH